MRLWTELRDSGRHYSTIAMDMIGSGAMGGQSSKGRFVGVQVGSGHEVASRCSCPRVLSDFRAQRIDAIKSAYHLQ